MSENDYGDCEENQKSRNNSELKFWQMKHFLILQTLSLIAMIPVNL